MKPEDIPRARFRELEDSRLPDFYVWGERNNGEMCNLGNRSWHMVTLAMKRQRR